MKYASLKNTGLALLLSASSAIAQDESDALRMSFLQPQGTARSMGFGSALGSVGGDFTSLSVNPAGIGIYRRSEFSFTPSLVFNSTTASAYGSASDASGAHFSFSNAGVVWTSAARGRRYERSPWKAVSFGFGINRLADFTRDYSYSGNNTVSSGSSVFVNDANYGSQDVAAGNTLAYLGYEGYLIDADTINGGYIPVISPSVLNPVRQNTSVKERGGISEVVFTLGGNYMEHLMLGATVGIPVINYSRDKTFSESGLAGATGNYLNAFSYTENLRTTGLGINLKLGAIFKPNDLFRLGVAVHTPSYIALTDAQDQSLNTTFIGFSPVNVQASQNQFDYTITTPWRGVASATGLFGKYGFASLDYEYVDYSSARFNFGSGNGDYQRDVNDTIKAGYRSASNIRLGVEFRLDALTLRAGYGYYGNPYKENHFSNGQHNDISAGIGFRGKSTFADLSYVHRMYQSKETPYYTAGVLPAAIIDNVQNNFALTVGWKF